MKNRLYSRLDNNQSKEQGGFRKKFSTIDHIFAVNQIIEKSAEYNLGTKLIFIYFNKAFD